MSNNVPLFMAYVAESLLTNIVDQGLKHSTDNTIDLPQIIECFNSDKRLKFGLAIADKYDRRSTKVQSSPLSKVYQVKKSKVKQSEKNLEETST
ncbi:MAG: hypothetical protein MHMPM18_003364 [Marteilia pararefringens]